MMDADGKREEASRLLLALICPASGGRSPVRENPDSSRRSSFYFSNTFCRPTQRRYFKVTLPINDILALLKRARVRSPPFWSLYFFPWKMGR